MAAARSCPPSGSSGSKASSAAARSRATAVGHRASSSARAASSSRAALRLTWMHGRRFTLRLPGAGADQLGQGGDQPRVAAPAGGKVQTVRCRGHPGTMPCPGQVLPRARVLVISSRAVAGRAVRGTARRRRIRCIRRTSASAGAGSRRPGCSRGRPHLEPGLPQQRRVVDMDLTIGRQILVAGAAAGRLHPGGHHAVGRAHRAPPVPAGPGGSRRCSSQAASAWVASGSAWTRRPANLSSPSRPGRRYGRAR